jgi:hypothetical protein
MRRRWLHSVALLLVVAMVTTGCGGDEREEGEGKATPTAKAAGGVEEYCDASLAIETAPEPEFDEDASQVQQAEATKKYTRETIRPLADKAISTAPEEIQDEARVLEQALNEVEQNGDFEAVFERPEVAQAEQKVHEYDLENCGWERVDVTGVNYAFQGVPSRLETGPTSFEFRNNGTELHEMIIFRKNPGTTESFDELLTLSETNEEEAFKKVAFVGGTDGPEPPNESTFSVLDLKAGEYAMVCFIPVGFTPEAAQAAEQSKTEPEGEPHYKRGMKSEFTVE